MAEKNTWWRSRKWTKPRVAKATREITFTLLQAALLTAAFALVGFALGYVFSPASELPQTENRNILLAPGGCPQIGAWHNLTTTPEGHPSPNILINFSSTNIRFANKTTPPDMRYLMLTLEITNSGYHIFDSNFLYFNLLINNSRYTPAILETLGLEDRLESKNLRSGERTNGSIIYIVPEGNITYQVLYRGARDFNITWRNVV